MYTRIPRCLWVPLCCPLPHDFFGQCIEKIQEKRGSKRFWQLEVADVNRRDIPATSVDVKTAASHRNHKCSTN